MNNQNQNLREIIVPATINLNMEVKTKENAISKLADMLYEDGRINERSLFIQDILEREKVETTDMGIGVAIPHGTSSSIVKNSIAIGRLTHPIAWDSRKEAKKISVIFLLAVCSENRDRTHLELISRIATLLLDDDFLDTLFHTTSKTELLLKIQSCI